MQNKELSQPEKKKKDIKADYAQLPAGPASGPAPSGSSLWPSSQRVQPLADLQNSLPQPFKR